ncbi:MAG: ABC transporter permease [Pseudomonadota bacterium]
MKREKDIQTERERGRERQRGFSDAWLNFVQPPFRSWVPEVLADELGIVEGQELELRDGRKLPPALIQARPQQGRKILLDLAAAFQLTGSQRLSYLALGDLTPMELEQLRRQLPKTLQIIENQQHLDLAQLTSSLHIHLSAMSLLSFAVGLFIVFNAVRFSLWYRRSTLRDLRLLGCTMKQLSLIILLETLCWSLLGASLGFLVGVLLAQLLLPGLGASLLNLYDAIVVSELGVSVWTFVQAWAMTLSGLLWALGWPLYRQLQRSGFEGFSDVSQHLDEAVARKWLRWASVVLLLLSWWIYGRVETVFQGFVVLGLILFAAAWLLPSLLAFSLKVISCLLPSRQWLYRWMVSDGWAQLPALRGAMMALLLALTANLGVGTLVDSFRGAFLDWLEVRQSADIYLQNNHLDYQSLIPGPDNAHWLAASNHRIGVTIRWAERPALVRGVNTEAPDSLAFPLAQWSGETSENALERWRKQNGTVLINEQLHYLAGVNIGDQIALPADSGLQKYEVVGVFYDYGNPYYQFYLPDQVLMEHWTNYYSRGIALWLNQDNDTAMQQALAGLESLGATPGDWIAQEDIRQLSLGIFDRTFAITAAMNWLTMIVAAIALLASLLAILQERLPQFAQWRALGLRQTEQLMLVATPLLIFSLVVWLFSIPLGALLSWILIDKLNVISFGWSMPLAWELEPAVHMALIVALIIVMTLLLVSFQWRRQLPRALAQLGEAT